ncbi:uncharacterized protein RCH25_052880 [Pelodytes ibericus]
MACKSEGQSGVDSKDFQPASSGTCENISEEVLGTPHRGSLKEDESPLKPESHGYIMTILLRITHIWPLKYVFKILKKMALLAGLSTEVENMCAAEPTSPRDRRFLCGKKRIGRLTRFILFITPHRLQCAFGFYSAESLGQASGSDDIRKSPLKPYGKGNKRKKDDLDLEEQQSWVTFMTEDLPDEDQDDDPTYEPSKSDTDSEENHSRNDTESDLETEVKDGIIMLKESVDQKESSCKEETMNGEKTNTEEQNTEENPSKTDGEDKTEPPTGSYD